MENNSIVQETLAAMKRNNFQHISKDEVISLYSQLSQMKPEVAAEILAQYPEFVKLAQSSLSDYKETIATAIASDDKSLKQVNAIAEKDLDADSKSRQQFFELAENVQKDISKCLENPDLTASERNELLDRQINILNIASEKDAEIRSHEAEIVRMVDRKDSEKRQFNWGVIKAASLALVVVGIGASVLGGGVDIKFPTKS